MMDIIIVFILCFCVLIFSVTKGIFVGYALLLSFFMFTVLAIKKGYPIKSILIMTYDGAKKSAIVLQIFILIGTITALWMSCGTVPAIVYYSMKFLIPNLFIFSAFIISAIVSVLLGTAFGTTGTAGLALIVIARAGGVSTQVAAGAIIAGAFFGDRCSPMSSSANLVSIITETNLYTNISNMIKTSIIPFILSIIFYILLSMKFPLDTKQNIISSQIAKTFNVGIVVLIPAFIIIIFSLFKVNVKISMLISIISAIVISIFVQHVSPVNVLNYSVFGFKMDSTNPLSNIISGGGIVSMVKASFVVLISSAISGIFEGAGILKSLEIYLSKACNKSTQFFKTIIVSILSSAFGCNQTLAIILTHLLVKKSYSINSIDNYSLAVDIENSSVVIPALLPWNIALLVPLTTLGADFHAIPYTFYLYMIPLTNLLIYKLKDSKILSIVSK